jgi:hypothetical protein
MQFLDIAQALATLGVYGGIATIGLMFASHLATYKPTSATPTPATQPEPTPEVEPEPVVEPDPIVEPEVIEPEAEAVDRVEELFAEYRAMKIRDLRGLVQGRVTGIRKMTRDVLARRLAEAVAAA